MSAAAVSAAYDWLMEGASSKDIGAALAEKFPEEDATAVLSMAWAAFAEVPGSNGDALAGWCLAAAREMYRKSVSIGDFANALRAIGAISALEQRPVASVRDDLEDLRHRRNAMKKKGA